MQPIRTSPTPETMTRGDPEQLAARGGSILGPMPPQLPLHRQRASGGPWAALCAMGACGTGGAVYPPAARAGAAPPPAARASAAATGGTRAGADSPSATRAANAATATAAEAPAMTAPPSRPDHTLTDAQVTELIVAALVDEGAGEGSLSIGSTDPAFLALKGGKQLNTRTRKATYIATDLRLVEINKRLDELELQVSHFYSTHYAGKVDMMHVKARVLCQAFWAANDVTVLRGPDGRTVYSVSGWVEIMDLTATSTVKAARDAATEIIAGSVAWRMCESIWPSIMGELSSGELTIDSFMRAARKVISIHLSYTQANGLTPVEARVVFKNEGVHDYAAIVREAITGAADRRERNRTRTARLRTLVREAQLDPSSDGPVRSGLCMTPRMYRAALPADASCNRRGLIATKE